MKYFLLNWVAWSILFGIAVAAFLWFTRAAASNPLVVLPFIVLWAGACAVIETAEYPGKRGDS